MFLFRAPLEACTCQAASAKHSVRVLKKIVPSRTYCPRKKGQAIHLARRGVSTGLASSWPTKRRRSRPPLAPPAAAIAANIYSRVSMPVTPTRQTRQRIVLQLLPLFPCSLSINPKQLRRQQSTTAVCSNGNDGAPTRSETLGKRRGATRSASSIIVDNDADEHDGVSATAGGVLGGPGSGGGARYAKGPSTRMNFFTAVNAALRTAMETDETAVRQAGRQAEVERAFLGAPDAILDLRQLVTTVQQKGLWFELD